MEPQYLVPAAIVISMILLQVNQRMASPVMSIVDRWLRWLVFSFGAAQLCRDFSWIDRPYWVLVASFFLLWFLAGTLYNWLAISALSVSPLPLFPRYSLNQSGEEWPVQPRLLRAREWLRSEGFRQVQALKAEIGGGIHLRSSVYEDAAGTLRLQVTFLPQSAGSIVVCHEFTSVAADGSRYVTDNLHIPFAGELVRRAQAALPLAAPAACPPPRAPCRGGRRGRAHRRRSPFGLQRGPPRARPPQHRARLPEPAKQARGPG